MKNNDESFEYDESVSSNLSFLCDEEQAPNQVAPTTPLAPTTNSAAAATTTPSSSAVVASATTPQTTPAAQSKNAKKKVEEIAKGKGGAKSGKGTNTASNGEHGEAKQAKSQQAGKKKQQNAELEEGEEEDAGQEEDGIEEEEEGDDEHAEGALEEEDEEEGNQQAAGHASEIEEEGEKDEEDEEEEEEDDEDEEGEEEGEENDDEEEDEDEDAAAAAASAADGEGRKEDAKGNKKKGKRFASTKKGAAATAAAAASQAVTTTGRGKASKAKRKLLANAAQASKAGSGSGVVGAQGNQKLNAKRNLATMRGNLNQDIEEESQQSSTMNNTASNNITQSSQLASSLASQAALIKQAKKLSSKFYLYKEGVKLPDLTDQEKQEIEVRVSKEYIHRFNKQYVNRNIWGNENYTSESDIVCILIHHGFLQFDSPQLRPDSQYAGVQVTLKVSKNRKTYFSFEKNGLVSRQTKNYAGFTIKPETMNYIPTLGSQDDLNRNARLMSQSSHRKKLKQNPVINNRTMLPIPEASVMFNMNNEPAFKYCISSFCDKSDEQTEWMSYRLRKAVLYVESETERYEISQTCSSGEIPREFDVFSLARIKNPMAYGNSEMSKVSVPLHRDQVEMIQEGLDWSDFKWGTSSLCVSEQTQIASLRTFKLYPRTEE